LCNEYVENLLDEGTPQEKSLSSRRKRKGDLMPESSECKKLLSTLMRHKSAPPFNQPVDPVALGIPHYFNVIKNPMDLGTISEKMSEYESAEDFAADVRLVWSNALLFNPPDHEVYMMAKTLSALFEKKIAPILKKAAAHSSPREPKRQHTEAPQSMTLTIGPKTEDNVSLHQKISQEIEDLCAEIDSVKKQISTLKEQLAASPPKAQPPKRQKQERPSETLPESASLPTREEKAELMQQIHSLSEQQLADVLHIINASNATESDEIEIDMERIDVATFRRFQAYVTKCLAEQTTNDAENSAAPVSEEQKTEETGITVDFTVVNPL
jgi:bromodomain-containing factor 1